MAHPLIPSGPGPAVSSALPVYSASLFPYTLWETLTIFCMASSPCFVLNVLGMEEGRSPTLSFSSLWATVVRKEEAQKCRPASNPARATPLYVRSSVFLQGLCYRALHSAVWSTGCSANSNWLKLNHNYLLIYWYLYIIFYLYFIFYNILYYINIILYYNLLIFINHNKMSLHS
jgi:hypothetical protein